MRNFKRILYIVLAIFILSLTRKFVFDISQVSAYSMESTLDDGTIVLVNKLAYGVRLPQSPAQIPFAEALAYSIGRHNQLINTKWQYRRLPGYAKIDKGDIVVFDHPEQWSNEMIVKRCVALPYDTISIINNRRYINGKEIEEPPMVKYSYNIFPNSNSLNQDSLLRYGVKSRDFLWESDSSFHYSMTKQVAFQLSEASFIDSVVIDNFPEGSIGPQLFPHNKKYTQENYGPLVVPGKEMKVELDTLNLPLFYNSIVRDENNVIEVNEHGIFINGVLTNSYTFKQNYYFFVGDNRYNSIDSRFWGFIPESAVIGKVSKIIYSKKEKI